MKLMYKTALGRLLVNSLFSSGALNLLVRLLYTPCSKIFIRPYIQLHKIDMNPFYGQEYKSYADFFARKKTEGYYSISSDTLISPCDGLLSVVLVDENTGFNIKGISYSINELIPDRNAADSYKDGLCLIFRLRAKDYHHFCFIDDCYHGKSHFIEGKLHSVQPIALEKEPVFRINRRMWSALDTKNFGQVVQIEVGAVLVGGIVLESENSDVRRGFEMGHFELCGSTIILFFSKYVRDNLVLLYDIKKCTDEGCECEVEMGQAIGYIKRQEA